MTRRGRPTFLAKLAALQDLAGVEHRRALEGACSETDRAAAEEVKLAGELRAAEAGLDAIHQDDRLCPVRLRIAAAIVDAGEKALTKGSAALREATAAEQEASLVWQAARHRTRWFQDRARILRRKEDNRRDEIADQNARALCLALGEVASKAFIREDRS